MSYPITFMSGMMLCLALEHADRGNGGWAIYSVFAAVMFAVFAHRLHKESRRDDAS